MGVFFKALMPALPAAAFSLWLWQTLDSARRKQARLERVWHSSQALNQVSQAIMATTGDLTLLMDTVESVAKTMRYDHAGVFLFRDHGALYLAVGYGYFLSPQGAEQEDRVGPAVLHALRKSGGRGRVVYPGASDGSMVPGVAWQALFPLAVRDRDLGALVVASDSPPGHADEAISMGESLAAQVAIGVQNIYLYQQRQELAAASERDRLAREIHDGIAQDLYMLSLALESCIEMAEQGPSGLKDRLEGALALSRSALLESRQYLLDLRPLLAGSGALRDAVRNLVKECQAVCPVPIDFSTSGEEREIDPSIQAALYRVAQEAIANALKHAKAGKIELRLEFRPESIVLEVKDDGMGFVPPERQTGHGLSNMRQRLEEIGGSLEVTTSPGNGAEIAASVPIRRRA